MIQAGVADVAGARLTTDDRPWTIGDHFHP